MFLTYQLSMVVYWPSMAVTGPIESNLEREPERRHHVSGRQQARELLNPDTWR